MQDALPRAVRRTDRPRLLVSVRSAVEARAAIDGGADILDVKDPASGPLGMASLDVIDTIAQTLREMNVRPIPLSAALGELRDFSVTNGVPNACDWVKIGLSGVADSDWQSRWRLLKDELRVRRPQTQLIAVVYADWMSCHAPPPDAVISAALATDVPGILFDTYEKRGQSLLDYLSVDELAIHLPRIHAANRFVALAGSLGISHLPSLTGLKPDIFAVRSAACAGGRQGRVEADRVAALQAAIKNMSPNSH